MFYSPGAFFGISQGHETEAKEIELLSPLFSKVVLQLISPVILSSVRRDMHLLTSLTMSFILSQVTFLIQPAVVFSMGGFHGTYLAYHFSVHNTLNSALEMGIWMTK